LDDVDQLLGNLSQVNVHFTAVRAGVNALTGTKDLAAGIARQVHSPHQNANGSNKKLRQLADDLLDSMTRIERAVTSGMERLERELGQTQERANRLRLLPCSAIFPMLARAARDAASSLGKNVEWQARGGEIRVEAQVLAVMRDAMLHLVRNSVAHGIETESARIAAGKPRSGLVEIQVELQSNQVTFLCHDDGAGIDVAGIRRVAVQKGLVSGPGADSLGLREAIDLILHGGVSTTGKATVISGRGIGLEAARKAAELLKGKISIETENGSG